MFMTPQQNGGQQGGFGGGGFGQQPNNFSFQQQQPFNPQMFGAMQQQMGAMRGGQRQMIRQQAGGMPPPRVMRRQQAGMGQQQQPTDFGFRQGPMPSDVGGFGGMVSQGMSQMGYAQPATPSPFGGNIAGTAPTAGGLAGAYLQQGIAPALQQMQQMYNSPSIAADIASLSGPQVQQPMYSPAPVQQPMYSPAPPPAPVYAPPPAAAPPPQAAPAPNAAYEAFRSANPPKVSAANQKFYKEAEKMMAKATKKAAKK